jgi:hypothetical protein
MAVMEDVAEMKKGISTSPIPLVPTPGCAARHLLAAGMCALAPRHRNTSPSASRCVACQVPSLKIFLVGLGNQKRLVPGRLAEFLLVSPWNMNSLRRSFRRPGRSITR